mmetsp:Transcript_8418/g.15827  ORF Transcript_8418/g.15827 Transcript_8418/m.15827 type:complete len:189 (+) Transcript_8418:46-612(+)
MMSRALIRKFSRHGTRAIVEPTATLPSCRLLSSAPTGRGGGGSVQNLSDAPYSTDHSWRGDAKKYPELHSLPGGRQPQKDFKVGPYAHTYQKDPATGKLTPVARFFVSPKEDPVTFVVNCLLALTLVWSISQLSWGESFFEKRRRVIRERIRQEYGLPKGWEHEIEEEDDLALSDQAPSPTAAAARTS